MLLLLTLFVGEFALREGGRGTPCFGEPPVMLVLVRLTEVFAFVVEVASVVVVVAPVFDEDDSESESEEESESLLDESESEESD